eukprot:GHVU01155083.1.p2 GENE.GHVU01155083.1~~GHVU01155083.1.p2  ORF type:complete len:118 (-),score=11.02 GHVU01155083.1:264-617(-)
MVEVEWTDNTGEGRWLLTLKELQRTADLNSGWELAGGQGGRQAGRETDREGDREAGMEAGREADNLGGGSAPQLHRSHVAVEARSRWHFGGFITSKYTCSSGWWKVDRVHVALATTQ